MPDERKHDLHELAELRLRPSDPLLRYSTVCTCGRESAWHPERETAEQIQRVHGRAARAYDRSQRAGDAVTGAR
jgi:hypothetical protein